MRISWHCLLTATCLAGLTTISSAGPLSRPTRVDPGAESSARDTEFAGSRILVRLKEPLVERNADGSFSLTTRSPELDAAVLSLGVHRIDPVFTTPEPRFPESFRRHGLDRTYVFHVPDGSDIRELVAQFEQLPEVEYAEPDYLDTPGKIPDDPLFFGQWSLEQETDADIDAPEAWDRATGNGVIAVIDSGIEATHDDLENQIVAGWDFVDNDDDPDPFSAHGTMVASVAAAETNNAKGMAGVCWDCDIMPLKTDYTASVTADATVWATDHGARVINYSSGRNPSTQTWFDAAAYAYEAGVTFVAITHNDGTWLIRVPARYLETIAVGATDQDDNLAGFSNYGWELDVVAPGLNITAAVLDNGYTTTAGGTSMAAPMVAGLAAIVRSVNPSVGREEVRHLIQHGAEERGDNPWAGFDPYHGWGRINTDRTLQATQSSISLRVEGKTATRVYYETANDLADSYDFIRGHLSDLSETAQGVDLGNVLCLENGSADADTSGGNEDTETPDPGEAFFYLGRFNVVDALGTWPTSYGGSSLNRDRIPFRPAVWDWAAESNTDDARFGISVGTAGDVNGDGFDDVIVGGDIYENGQEDEGAAWLYFGSGAGLVPVAAWMVEGDQDFASFGWSVASAGDVNGDGNADLIVGAPYYDNGEEDEGMVFVYHGGPVPPVTPSWTAEGDQAGAWFGYRVRSAGDVNSDGYDDVIIGAPRYDNPDEDEGRAYLYLGSAHGLLGSPLLIVESNQPGAQLGRGVGAAGDVNNDGYGDIVIGAPRYDNGETNEGRLYVYAGRMLGPPTLLSTLEIDSPDARLGYAAAGAGDVNDDGFDDIISGAYLYSNNEPSEGGVFVFQGSPTGPTVSPSWSFEADMPYVYVGVSAEAAGDVDGDGYDDVLVGGDGFHLLERDEGRVWLFRGSESGLETTASWTATGGQRNGRFGWRAGTAGDVNDDGHSDLIVGAFNWDHGTFNEGRVFAYYGSPTGPAVPEISACDEP